MVFGDNIGMHTTLFKGDGYDFCELREYQNTDDVKNIDWIISAKVAKPMVKIYHQERNQHITLVAFMNGTLYFGTDEFKNEKLAHIATIFSYLALQQHDTLNMFIANTTLTPLIIKNKSYDVPQTLLSYECLGHTINYEYILFSLAKRLKNRSIIIFLGDFLDSHHFDISLLAKKHEIVVAIIRDRFEEHPKISGKISLCDNQNNSFLEASITNTLIHNYEKHIAHNDKILYTKLQKQGVRFATFYTNEDITQPFMELLR